MYKYLIPIILLIPVLAHADMNAAMQALKNGDHARAATEFKQLAEQGNASAQSHLGYLYYSGEGVPQSFAEAVKWYQKAAVQGNKDAQYNLAVAYAFGEGVKQDYKEAAVWYRRAAEQGHSVAQYSLGLSYAYGEGVAQDEKAAAEWFMKSAEQGYENAQVMVASLYHTGDGLPKDYTKAVEWYRKAAGRGNAIAQYNLGAIYRAGKGVDKNTDEAIKWFRLAADQGYEAAQNELSTMERAMAGAAKQTTPVTTLPSATPETQAAAKESTPPSTHEAQTTIQHDAESAAPIQQESKLTPDVTEHTQSTRQQSTVSEPEPAVVTEQEPTLVNTEVETAITEPEQSGGFFSRLKNLFKAEEGTAATELVEDTVPEVEVMEETVSVEKTTPAPEPEIIVEEKSTEKIADVTPPQEKKRLFTPGKNPTSVFDMTARPSVEAPQISSSPEQTQITALINTETSAETQTEPEPEPVAMVEPPSTTAIVEPEPVQIVDEQPATEITTNEKNEIATETESSDSGGLFGFFGRMFSSDEDEIVEEQIAEETITDEKPEQPSDAISYSVDSKPGDQQLAAIVDEPVEETNITPITGVTTRSEPATIHIDKEVYTPDETTTASIETDVATEADDKKDGAGSFFSRLFGSDDEADDETVVAGTDTDVSVNIADQEQVSAPDDNWEESLQEPSDVSQLQTEHTAASDDLTEAEPLHIAKADVQPSSAPLETTIEQELKTSVSDPLDALKALAVSGEPMSQYELGKHYYEGNQVKQDFSEAFIWYRRSALQGNADAQYNLGSMYLMGEGISQSDIEARNWYEKAALQGHEAAKHNFENLKQVVPESTTKVAKSEPIAVSADNSKVEKDKEKSGLLSRLFGSEEKEEKTEQPVVSPETAVSQPEVNNTKSPAQSDHDRGLAYTYGDGVPQNYTTAFKYFQSAALQGYAPAQYQLGIAYESGQGTQKDTQSAIEWYEKAAKQRHSMAQRTLGNLYMNGEGVNQNKPLALAWYSILAERGNVLDVHRRDLLKQQLTDAEIRESERLKQQLSANLSTASTTF